MVRPNPDGGRRRVTDGSAGQGRRQRATPAAPRPGFTRSVTRAEPLLGSAADLSGRFGLRGIRPDLHGIRFGLRGIGSRIGSGRFSLPRLLGLCGLLGLLGLCVPPLAAQPYAGPYPGGPYAVPPWFRPPPLGVQPAPQGPAAAPRAEPSQAPRPAADGRASGQPPAWGQPAAGASQAAQPAPGAARFRPLPATSAQGTPPTYQPPVYGSPGYAQPGGQPAAGTAYGQLPYGTQGYAPGWYPGYASTASAATPPELTWSLAETQPYVQQPVVLTLELISSDNLSTLDLQLPSVSDALIKQLRGPDTSTREVGGRRQIVNAYKLVLVPLRAGTVELPPLKAAGIYASQPQRFLASSASAPRLQVRPSMTSVRPWLPLRDLQLTASLDRQGPLEPGQPVTLTLAMEALGATAAQLPTLEGQLVSSDLRVYREQTLTDTRLTPDGEGLVATRTEYYTLVPQAGGRISLPEMGVPWWNVVTGTREVTRLPIKTLEVRGGGPLGLAMSRLTASGWTQYWLPLAGLGLLLLGYWGGVLYRARVERTGESFPRMLGKGVGALLRLVARWLPRLLSRLDPRPLVAWGRQTLRRLMPASSHLLGCVRHANQAADPTSWRNRFEDEARRCLRFQGEFTQPALTQQILEVRPGADRATLEHLMAQLDAARYGQQPLDFGQWKRQLMREIGRGPRLARRRAAPARRIRWAALPALNPSVTNGRGVH